MGGSSVSIDKDKVDAWLGSMQGAFTGPTISPMTVVLIAVSVTLAILLVVWISRSGMHGPRRRHA